MELDIPEMSDPISNVVAEEEKKLDIVTSEDSNTEDKEVIGTGEYAVDWIDASTLSADDLRRRALSLQGNMNCTAIDLAEVLHTIYHGEKWRDYGFISFEKYVEAELEVGYRSAMMSVKIISTMKEHGIPMLQGRRLGWGRMRAILRHITSTNINSLLSMASSRSVREIQLELANTHALTDTAAQSETHQLTFDCTASEASIILDALDEAKKRLNTESKSSALEFVAQEWSVANEGEVSQVSLQDIIDFCERNYGVVLSLEVPSDKEDDKSPEG